MRLTLPVLAAAAALALPGPGIPAARGSTDVPAGAAALLRLDPAARLGGNTQVATGRGTTLWGVPGRVNFMLALGPDERIVGGPGADELGSRGSADRIEGRGGNDLIRGGPGADAIDGGRGDDLLYGGGGHDRLDGGPGDDRLVAAGGAVTVRPGAGSDVVDVRDGRGDDRVICAPGSDARVTADPGDRIGAACRRAHASAAIGPAPAGAAQGAVTGDGTNGSPFTAPCSAAGTDCAVNAFPARQLAGFWSNEYVPAYRCPTDHPYLIYGDWAPFGTTVPPGVEVAGLGPVGVAITGLSSTPLPRPGLPPRDMVTGTTTGLGNSSATNWDGYGSAYTVILHCTSDVDHAYATSGP